MIPEERLATLGLALPPAWAPGARLEMATRYGDFLFLAAHMGIDMHTTVKFHGRADHRPLVAGRVGADIDLDRAVDVARGGALNLLATVRQEVGELAKVRQILKVTAFVNTVPDYELIHKVADAASDLLVDVLGSAGPHARATIGTSSLPGNSCFAIDAICAVS